MRTFVGRQPSQRRSPSDSTFSSAQLVKYACTPNMCGRPRRTPTLAPVAVSVPLLVIDPVPLIVTANRIGLAGDGILADVAPTALRLLGIDPEEEFIAGLIWYGYPKVIPTQSRKDVAEIVTERK